jgi:hypothetical protein
MISSRFRAQSTRRIPSGKVDFSDRCDKNY